MAKRKQPIDATQTEKLTVDEFIAACSTPRKETLENGVIVLKSPLFTRGLFLQEYAYQMFNCAFVKIEVDPDKKEVKIWRNYGEKKVDEEGNPIRDADGNFTYSESQADMVINNILKD